MQVDASLIAPEQLLEIHTSDRISYRQCRRRWNFGSQIRQSLTSASDSVNEHLWFGSGIHFALEDFHGHNSYGTPYTAFLAYCHATRKQSPDNVLELKELAEGMLAHYQYWIGKRDDMRTLVFDNGEPAVEVNWHVPLPELGENIFYSGTFDRLVLDDHDRVWILDYKTAQRFNTSKLEMDPQCSAYCWAFQKLYGFEAEGVIYIQLLKDVPQKPYILKSGEVSVNKAQATTYDLYKRTLIEVYGNSIKRIPPKCLEFCHFLASQETQEGDKFIKRDLVRRNAYHVLNEEWKIMAEGREMLDPHTPLYPNPTRDCSWMCDFRGVCVAMDDGSDWQTILTEGYRPRQEMHEWRANLVTSKELHQILGKESPSLSSQEANFQIESEE